jgi:hypothetical protein
LRLATLIQVIKLAHHQIVIAPRQQFFNAMLLR